MGICTLLTAICTLHLFCGMQAQIDILKSWWGSEIRVWGSRLRGPLFVNLPRYLVGEHLVLPGDQMCCCLVSTEKNKVACSQIWAPGPESRVEG